MTHLLHASRPVRLPLLALGFALLLTLTLGASSAFAQADVVKFANGEGGLPTATLSQFAGFGSSAAPLGDFNGDGVPDLVVGAPNDEFQPFDSRGAVYVLFLNGASSGQPGTINSFFKIGEGSGGLPSGTLSQGDSFGSGVAAPGDLDGDGLPDLLVGADEDDTGANFAGAVYALFLQANGQVKPGPGNVQKIANGVGGLPVGTLIGGDVFGRSITPVGDLDGDGVTDIAVGAPFDDTGEPPTSPGGFNAGSVYILFLNGPTSGQPATVKGSVKIANGLGGLPAATLDRNYRFGNGLAGIGDLDGDTVPDLVVGAPGDDAPLPGGLGALYVLFLNGPMSSQPGTVKGFVKIFDGQVGVPSGAVGTGDFGTDVASLGDIDGDGGADVLVGAPVDALDPFTPGGAVFTVFLNGSSSSQPGTVKDGQRIGDGDGGLPSGTLGPSTNFGGGVAFVGDVNSDGATYVLAGAPEESVGAFDSGSAYLLRLNADGAIPVELVGLTAHVQENDVVLRWQTASETNNAGFFIEQQEEGGPWRDRGFVDGAGTTAKAQTYSFRILDVRYGRHAFRLRQIDLDGTETLSPVAMVEVGLTEPFAVAAYPNPFAETATLEVTVRQTQRVRVAVYDLLGRRVATLHNGTLHADRTKTLSWNGRGQASAMYIVRVQGETFHATERLSLLR